MGQLRRTEHWATREYHQFLVGRAKTPFAWGANDCALFAADGILAMTGVDIAAEFRGKYDSEATALAAIQEVCGGATVADAAAHCASVHGLVEWTYPLMARRGDLVVLVNGDRLISGLVHLNGRHAVTPGDHGLVRMPITAVRRSWHV
jgi:hypothetical protein